MVVSCEFAANWGTPMWTPSRIQGFRGPLRESQSESGGVRPQSGFDRGVHGHIQGIQRKIEPLD
jgi:hypothetical protein